VVAQRNTVKAPLRIFLKNNLEQVVSGKIGTGSSGTGSSGTGSSKTNGELGKKWHIFNIEVEGWGSECGGGFKKI